MDGFDTMTMSYLASPLSLNNMQNADYLNAMPTMDMQQDQHSNFDTDTFVRYMLVCRILGGLRTDALIVVMILPLRNLLCHILR